MKHTSHPPTRRTAPARTGEVCPLAPTAIDALAVLLQDIQAAIPNQGHPPLAAALDACIARIIHLLLAVMARFAVGQPLAVVPTPAPHPATTAGNPSPAPAATAHASAVSHPSRDRNAKPRHTPPTPTRTGSVSRRVIPTAPNRPRPDTFNAVIARCLTGHPRRRAASSRAPPDGRPGCAPIAPPRRTAKTLRNQNKY